MEEKIIALIEDMLQVEKGTICQDTKIEDVENWDSLTHVAIIGELEETLGISVPLEQSAEINCVGELLELCGCGK
ncbi:MAG: acyl carrier protein [Lachnospiraceae bacterium]|nr:acyl carrier protein [Lachnospiraceae bacterium]